MDLCTHLGLCLPPASAFLDGCRFHAVLVRGALPTEGCAASAAVYACEVEYFGGSPGGVLGNLRLTCWQVLALP